MTEACTGATPVQGGYGLTADEAGVGGAQARSAGAEAAHEDKGEARPLHKAGADAVVRRGALQWGRSGAGFVRTPSKQGPLGQIMLGGGRCNAGLPARHLKRALVVASRECGAGPGCPLPARSGAMQGRLSGLAWRMRGPASSSLKMAVRSVGRAVTLPSAPLPLVAIWRLGGLTQFKREQGSAATERGPAQDGTGV